MYIPYAYSRSHIHMARDNIHLDLAIMKWMGAYRREITIVICFYIT